MSCVTELSIVELTARSKHFVYRWLLITSYHLFSIFLIVFLSFLLTHTSAVDSTKTVTRHRNELLCVEWLMGGYRLYCSFSHFRFHRRSYLSVSYFCRKSATSQVVTGAVPVPAGPTEARAQCKCFTVKMFETNSKFWINCERYAVNCQVISKFIALSYLSWFPTPKSTTNRSWVRVLADCITPTLVSALRLKPQCDNLYTHTILRDN